MVEAVLAKDVGHSEVVLKAVDRVKEVKAKIGIKGPKFTMDSQLLLQVTLKALEMGLKEVHQKGENPSIKGPENREIQAKASDLYRFSAK